MTVENAKKAVRLLLIGATAIKGGSFVYRLGKDRGVCEALATYLVEHPEAQKATISTEQRRYTVYRANEPGSFDCVCKSLKKKTEAE